MKVFDLIFLQKELFEIKKEYNVNDLKESIFVLRFDFIQTEKTLNKIEKDAEFW